MSHQPHDLTPLPDLLHGAALAGPLRTRKPIYADLLPPCNAGCPAGENIQAWLASTRAGEHERAWRQLVENNPLPAIHGRVCYHPCEDVCNQGPSGLSAAYHLARRGHDVEIRDGGSEPGGMMRYGIPAYRLPRDVLAGELARIEALGVRMT